MEDVKNRLEYGDNIQITNNKLCSWLTDLLY